ncbi:NlpC/P60 family protein [Roseiterribacter gracilis]|uniref:Peptidase P60 n=1 Tax=Roseiterribacter gracilis TaxID=2812848 RepID=A0A8S8X8R3_9PROT|nr:peptidase P60 [Rhodospirillales bacterium TMPK1]
MSVPARIIAAAAPLKGRPDFAAELATELLFGERVTVGFARDDWAEVVNATDGYRGFVPAETLGEDADSVQPTHKIGDLRGFVYGEPNMKTTPLTALSFLSTVQVTGEKNGFFEIEHEGWIYHRHLVALDHVETDPVATALRFLGVPYLWGGRTSLGLDCSALVQLSLAAAGIAAPRDSGPQSQKLGQRVVGDVRLQRGDLCFWPGHVAMAVNETEIVHANAHWMSVVREPLADLVARVDRAPDVRRL